MYVCRFIHTNYYRYDDNDPDIFTQHFYGKCLSCTQVMSIVYHDIKFHLATITRYKFYVTMIMSCCHAALVGGADYKYRSYMRNSAHKLATY